MLVVQIGSREAGVYLDVPVGDAQAVAEVDGHDELLEQAARPLLRQRATLQQVRKMASMCFLGSNAAVSGQL
jgi:hypothetical protein